MAPIRDRIKAKSWGKADLLQIHPVDQDAFVDRLLRAHVASGSKTDGEHYGYSGSPVSAILGAIDGLKLQPNDVFFDMGAGLGKVVLLAAILTGCQARAVEHHAPSCEHLRRVAEELGLTDQLLVIDGDARKADLSAGTAFFFLNPFTGSVMKEVSEKIAANTKDRPVRIASFGPTNLSGFRDWLPGHKGPCQILRSPTEQRT